MLSKVTAMILVGDPFRAVKRVIAIAAPGRPGAVVGTGVSITCTCHGEHVPFTGVMKDIPNDDCTLRLRTARW
jgi:hypothetical protein